MQEPGGSRPMTAVEADGWVQFAGIMILMVGVFNGIDGFVALLRSSYFAGTPIYGNLFFWSIVWLAFGIAQVLAGFAILSQQTWGRWFGIVTVSLNALVQLFAIALYPWWSIVIIAFDVAIIYALTARWGRRTTLA